jgi:hypothetical protein
MHLIRLRDPWDVESEGTVVRWRRFFNRPTGLSPGDAVELRFENLADGAILRLNSELLEARSGEAGWTAVAVAPLLKDRNEIIIELHTSQARPFEQAVLALP